MVERVIVGDCEGIWVWDMLNRCVDRGKLLV